MNQVVAAYCQTLVRCGYLWGDVASCLAFIAADHTSNNSPNAVLAAVHAGQIHVDVSQAQACIDGIDALNCQSPIVPDFTAAPGCSGLVTGTIPSGGTCIANAECAGSAMTCFQTTAQSSTGCAGTCIAAGTMCISDTDCTGGRVCSNGSCATPNPAAGANGQACGQNESCQQGLTCLASGSSMTCGAPPTAGQPCDVTDGCAPGLWCDLTLPTPTCTAPAGRGEHCLLGDYSCQTGMTCVPSPDLQSETCLPPAAPGEACTTLFQCGGVYGLYYCDDATKKCVARPTSGPCPGGRPGACDWRTTRCDATQTTPTCVPYVSSGGSCTSDTDCGFTGGTCANQDPSTGTGTCQSAAMCMP